MNRKLVLIMTLMLLIGMLNVAFNAQKAEASGTIYIRADGSVDPPTAELSSNDNMTYSMTGNLNISIVIEKNDILFDGAGYTLQGSGSGNGIELSERNNVTIRDIEIRGFYQGILIYNFSRGNDVFGIRAIDNWYGGICVDSSANNNITGNAIVNGMEGIILSGSENNLVSGNNIKGSEFYGLNLISTSNNWVENNEISNCGWHGIKLWMASCNNTIDGNNVTDCKVGIEVSYSSNNNTVSANCLSMNRIVGVVIGFRIPESGPDWGGAADNHIIENNVTSNNLGIELIYSKNNTVFHNNIEENNASVAIIGSYVNTWDDGYPSGGNCWSDYAGVDEKSGSCQNETGSDGIGDAAYAIDANNVDHYPLVGMFQSYDVTYFTLPLVAHSCNVTVISNSTVSNFASLIWIEHPEVIMIEFNVTGEEGTTGFCRVSFPTAMMNSAYHVFVNGTEVPCTLLPCSNSDYSYLYFTYMHSTDKVTITPEFPSFLVLPPFMIMTLLAVKAYKRRTRR